MKKIFFLILLFGFNSMACENLRSDLESEVVRVATEMKASSYYSPAFFNAVYITKDNEWLMPFSFIDHNGDMRAGAARMDANTCKVGLTFDMILSEKKLSN